MTDAKRDHNSVTVALGVDSADGKTPKPLRALDGVLKVNDNTTGSDAGGSRAAKDANSVPTLVATASDGSLVALYVDSTGALLTKST